MWMKPLACATSRDHRLERATRVARVKELLSTNNWPIKNSNINLGAKHRILMWNHVDIYVIIGVLKLRWRFSPLLSKFDAYPLLVV